jgi:hypothetical protein
MSGSGGKAAARERESERATRLQNERASKTGSLKYKMSAHATPPFNRPLSLFRPRPATAAAAAAAMSSPRSMLPATVLLKLQEESYSRRKHNYYSQDRSSLCDNSDVVRRRCYSESAHISADTATNGVNMGGSLKGTRSPVRGARKSELGLSPPPSSFCLGASITKVNTVCEQF